MPTLLLGATGFLGPHVARALATAGHDVLAAARAPGRAAPRIHPIPLDRSDPAAVARAVAAHGCETVIDLIAYTEADTLPLIDALAGRIGRYVLASSADVYGRYGALHRREPRPPGDGPPPEDAPLRTRPYPYRPDPPRAPPRAPAAPDAWMDAYDKIPLEAAARARLPAVIARLPMVYGPGDRQRRFRWAIAPMARGRDRLELDAAWAAWRTSYGYVEDVAAALALCATHPAALGQTYNLGPCAEDAPNQLAWARRIADAVGWTGEIVPVPRAALPAPTAQALDALDLSCDLVTDTTRLRRDLGYVEPTAPAEALARTIADERARG